MGKKSKTRKQKPKVVNKLPKNAGKGEQFKLQMKNKSGSRISIFEATGDSKRPWIITGNSRGRGRPRKTGKGKKSN